MLATCGRRWHRVLTRRWAANSRAAGDHCHGETRAVDRPRGHHRLADGRDGPGIPPSAERQRRAAEWPAHTAREWLARVPDVLRAHRRARRSLLLGGRTGPQRQRVRSRCRRAPLPVRPGHRARLARERSSRPGDRAPADPGRAGGPVRRRGGLAPARAPSALVDGPSPGGGRAAPRRAGAAGAHGGAQPFHRGRPQAGAARQPRLGALAQRARGGRGALLPRARRDVRGRRADRHPGGLGRLRRVALLGLHRPRTGRRGGDDRSLPRLARGALRHRRRAADGLERRRRDARDSRGPRPRRATHDPRRQLPAARERATRDRLLPLPARGGGGLDPALLPRREAELAAADPHRRLLRLLLLLLRPRPGRRTSGAAEAPAQPGRRLPLRAQRLLPRGRRERGRLPLARAAGHRAAPRQAVAGRDGPGGPAQGLRRPRVPPERGRVDRHGAAQRALRPGERQRALVLRLRPLGLLAGSGVITHQRRSA